MCTFICGGPAICVGLSGGMGPNVWIFKVQNGEYGGADEPQNPQDFVK